MTQQLISTSKAAIGTVWNACSNGARAIRHAAGRHPVIASLATAVLLGTAALYFLPVQLERWHDRYYSEFRSCHVTCTNHLLSNALDNRHLWFVTCRESLSIFKIFSRGPLLETWEYSQLFTGIGRDALLINLKP